MRHAPHVTVAGQFRFETSVIDGSPATIHLQVFDTHHEEATAAAGLKPELQRSLARAIDVELDAWHWSAFMRWAAATNERLVRELSAQPAPAFPDEEPAVTAVRPWVEPHPGIVAQAEQAIFKASQQASDDRDEAA